MCAWRAEKRKPTDADRPPPNVFHGPKRRPLPGQTDLFGGEVPGLEPPSVHEDDRPVAYACTFAGLRISEALGLRWRDLDLRAGTIDVAGQLAPSGWVATTKTPSSSARVKMLPALRRELVEHRSRQASRSLALVRSNELVFTTLPGKPQSRRNALRALHQAGDTAGLNGEGRQPSACTTSVTRSSPTRSDKG